jgi:hypothetical protein
MDVVVVGFAMRVCRVADVCGVPGARSSGRQTPATARFLQRHTWIWIWTNEAPRLGLKNNFTLAE